MTKITTDPMHIFSVKFRAVSGGGATFEPAAWEMATITKLPNTFNILISNGNSCPEDRITSSL